jgi:hypothetical protein
MIIKATIIKKVVNNQTTLSIDNQIFISPKEHKGKTQRITKIWLIIIHEFEVFAKDLAVFSRNIMRYTDNDIFLIF